MKQKIIILISILVIAIFIVDANINYFSDSSNNKVKYQNENKVAHIKNKLNKTIASAKLITPHINYVIRGKNRRVMIFTIENLEDNYYNALNGLEIINKKNEKKIVRDYHWEYAVNYEVDVNDYETICSPTGKIDLKNGTTETSCTSVISGTHKETRTRWENLTSTNLPKGNITIALVTDVLPGDYMDGIPILFGKKIDRWAIWTESMSAGLKHYFNMTGSGATFYNQINSTANGTAYGSVSRTFDGFIGDGLQNSNFSAPDINKMISPGRLPPAPFTFSAWINPSEYNPNSEITQSGSGSGEDRFYVSLNSENQIAIPDILVSVPDIPLNNWTYLTIIYHGEGLYSIYHNGTFVSNKTGQNMSSARDGSWNIRLSGAGQASGYSFVGKIDEVAYWNKSLSETEINNMYNGGEGISYAPSYPPTLSILFPTSANYSSIITEINYSVSNATYPLDACWYSLDNGLTNTTITCGENITGISSSEGNNTWIVYVNDTEGLTDSDSVTFIQDTFPPNITIKYPLNNTGFQYNISAINYSVSEDITSLDTCWYSLDNGLTNTTITCGENITGISSSWGHNNWTICSNDTSGNSDCKTSEFWIDTDNPNIFINSPKGTISSLSFQININASDTTSIINSCTYNITRGASTEVATTSINLINFTESVTVSSDAIYIVTVECLDIAGNSNITSNNFTVDTTAPPSGGGGGGGATIIIGSEEAAWTMETEGGGSLYEYNMIPSSSKTKSLLFENLGSSSRTITLSCEGDLCQYIEFPERVFVLPLQKEIKFAHRFIINLPEDINGGPTATNIIATDDLNNRGVITVKIDVVSGFNIKAIMAKLSSSKIIGDIPIPYALIAIVVIFMTTMIGGFILTKANIPAGLPLAFIAGLIFGIFIILIF